MRLRIIHAGVTTPLYSQAIYHGIAEQMQAEDDPVLIIVQPDKPYICIGLHQQLRGEINITFCKKNEVSILRRQVGGGTVLLDENQLFFQFVFPKNKAPNQPKLLYPYLLTPVLKTYQYFGIPATLKSLNDIQVNNKKIGGTGAGTINNATVLVGSFLFDFDYKLMSQCINSPSKNFRVCLQKILEQNITTIKQETHFNQHTYTETNTNTAQLKNKILDQFIKETSLSLKMKSEDSALLPKEITAIREAENDLCDEEWLYDDGNKLIEKGLKISSGKYLLETMLTFNKLHFTIRVLYKNKTIDKMWIETEKKEQTLFFLKELVDKINTIKPLINYKIILKIAMNTNRFSPASKLPDTEINHLVNTIINLCNIREY